MDALSSADYKRHLVKYLSKKFTKQRILNDFNFFMNITFIYSIILDKYLPKSYILAIREALILTRFKMVIYRCTLIYQRLSCFNNIFPLAQPVK
jgi:hypothetical protein